MQEVQNIFNKLPQEDKRKFIITNMLKDVMFAGYHTDLKNDFMQYIYSKEQCEKLIKERTEKRFIECCYSIFREYEDAVNKCVKNGSKNIQDIYNILKAQNIIETYAECEIINCKDRFGDSFADMIVNLYNNTNPTVVKHLNDKDVSLKAALIALFENPHLLKKTREKYKKYEIEANKLTFEDSNMDDTDSDEENYNSAQRRFIYGTNDSSESSDSESDLNIDSDDDYKPKPKPNMTEEELFERLQTPISLLNTMNAHKKKLGKKAEKAKDIVKEATKEEVKEVKEETKVSTPKKTPVKKEPKTPKVSTPKKTPVKKEPKTPKVSTPKKTPTKKEPKTPKVAKP